MCRLGDTPCATQRAYHDTFETDADFRAAERLANALHREKNQTGKVFHDATGVTTGKATPLNLFDELEELACGELNVLDQVINELCLRLDPILRPSTSAPDDRDGECELASEARIAVSGLRARVRGQISVLSGILERLDLP